MTNEEVKILIDQYLAGTCTPEEAAQIETWYLIHHEDRTIDVDIAAATDRVWARLERKPARLWPRYAAAASILLAIGTYLLWPKPSAENILPVQQGVTLTLGSGQKIKLHPGTYGTAVATDQALTYNGQGRDTNTLTNNGNTKYSVNLSDGTQVTLDIGSSLTYPISGREVSLVGQAYFKVKHANQHFLVHTRDQLTEDLGTEFNISAYADETTKTTLIEGQIKVNEKLLKPGEQFAGNEVHPADLEEVTAWLQDQIVLEQQTLETILRKVARIYDVKIIYLDPEVKSYVYGGAVKTSTKLSSVLNFLRKAGRVDFKVAGKQIQVFKKERSAPAKH